MFRDYGLYDHAMLRFSKGHKISDNFYVRQDGTRAYYFSEGQESNCAMADFTYPLFLIDQTANLFTENGFKLVENSYVQRQTVNKKEDITAERIFLQGKFEKLSKHITV